MATTRWLHMDVLRILSIYCVGLGHVIANRIWDVSVSSFAWQCFNAYEILLRFCVPCLMMISGALFLNQARKVSFKKILSKNVLRIVCAYFVWSAFYALITLYRKSGHFTDFSNANLGTFLSEVVEGHYHMWFLRTLLGLYLLIPALRWIAQRRARAWCTIVIVFLYANMSLLFPKLCGEGGPLRWLYPCDELTRVIGYSGYFLMGNELNTIDFSKWKRWTIYGIGALAVASGIVLNSQMSLHAQKTLTLMYELLLPHIYLWSVAIFVFFKACVSKIQWKPGAQRVIVKVSGLTFGVYLIHDFFLTLLRSFGLDCLNYNVLFSAPLVALLIFFISLAATWIIDKIPVINRYII